MGTTTDKLNYLISTKEAIRQAINNKGVQVSTSDNFRTYANKIEQISGGGGTINWITYLENKLLNIETATPYRHIQLMTDMNDTFTMTATNGNSDMIWYTSDGAVYEWQTGGVSHTWDKSQDIDFGGEFKVRWVICSMRGPGGYVHLVDEVLYCVVELMEINSNSIFKGKRLLRGVKFINGAAFKNTLTSMNYALFSGCVSLNMVDGLNLQYVTTAMGNNCFATCLTTVKNWSGINASMDLKDNILLTRDSLFRIIYALNDLSGSTSQTLTLQSTLLAKLTDRDREMVASKNWTLV